MPKKNNIQSSASADRLKRKAAVCSTEAAAISIGVHVLLILLAGSVVAIRYVQKRDAAFSGENVSRPKLERRQLQMPVKVKNLQKKSRRPKVTTRMATVSKASFSLPDMSGLGDLAGGFDRSDIGGRGLGNMGSAGSLGFGVSGVNFFGAKSKGEKMVFVISANKLMVEDRKGGYHTYQFVKNRLVQLIDGMSSATLFNVMVYAGNGTVMFRSKLVAATPENRDAVKNWIAPVNSSPEVVARLDKLPGIYQPPRLYEDSPVGNAWDWLVPLQAAMEQNADNIFILCGRLPYGYPSEEELMVRHDIDSMTEWLEGRGWDAERIAECRRKGGEIRAAAARELEKENKARAAAGEPPKIVADWNYYICEDLGWRSRMPESPPTLRGLYSEVYTPEDMIGHIDEVYSFNYVPKKLSKPSVHIVKLIASDDETGQEIGLNRICKDYKGRFEFLRGAETVEDLLQNNDLALE